MHIRYRILLSILFLTLSLGAQPKREFRGAWIATVTNVDWPIVKTDTPAKQQTDMMAIIDSLDRVGFNAVVFQVRPSADAAYASTIEPWSEWITGTQGVPPSSANYDPLTFILTYAHSKKMEVHAWFNPYRTVVNDWVSSVSASHISKTRPDLVKKYPIYAGSVPNRKTTGNLVMLDPGIPEVRTYVLSVIMDVLRRYDIDGVHFDDYFYPYPTTDSTNASVPFSDSDSFAAYNPGGLPLGDWRRENVNQLVKMVHDSIRAVKPQVKFGISPFGIWRNQSNDPLGSNTTGLDSYSQIYTDVRRWLQEGWLDYVTPQVYWRMGYAIADYAILVPWWDQNSFGRHVYVGQAPYRMFNGNGWPAWEIIDQIALNRTRPNVLGSVHFSAKYFHRSAYRPNGLNDSLKSLAYQSRALRPTMAWIDSVAPLPPESLTIQKYTSFGLLKWKSPSAASDGQLPQEYILYRSKTLPFNFNDMSSALFVGTATSRSEGNPGAGETMYYAVTSLDRHQNESGPSNIMGLTQTGTVGVPDDPNVPQTMRLHQNFPNPFNPVTMIWFEVQQETHASLRVYDLLGREVAVLWDGITLPGTRQVSFDGVGLASGVYFYRLIAMGKVETRRMQLVR